MKPGAPDPDASCHRDIVSEAQNGNKEALRHLYESAARRIHSLIHAIVGANHADDVAADTWVRILVHLRSYRPELGDFHAWAAVIARNQALDHLRRQHQHRTVSVGAHQLPHGVAPDNTENQALERIATLDAITTVTSLPRDQAAAVLLCVIIGIDTPSASRILHKKPGAIRTAQHRGLKSIKTRILISPAT